MNDMFTALQRASERLEYRIAPTVLLQLAKAAEWRVAEMQQEIQDTRKLNANLADSLASTQHQLAAAKQRIADLEKPGDLREFLTEIRRELRRAA